jgi:hypothetical protein
MIAIIILLTLTVIIFIITKSFLSKNNHTSSSKNNVLLLTSLLAFFNCVGLRLYEFHINLNSNLNFYKVSEYFLFASACLFIMWIIAKLFR